NRKASNFPGVYVARDMALALVPDIRIDVAPSVLFKDWMDCGPSDFRVPKPQGSRWHCILRPRGDMRLVPFGQTEVIASVAFEAKNAVTPIRHDDRRHL